MTEEQETFERFLPEKDKAFKYCAECGCELGDEFYLFTDNYLQLKYFDSNENNAFCSPECACEALMLQSIPNTKKSFETGGMEE
ncbi:MAG: hypothetical protein ACI4IR_06945 [Eubacterium sp.]